MFPQQIDPFTSTPDKGDRYGPMMLSLLEYSSLSMGVAVRADDGGSILWSSVRVAADGEPPVAAEVPPFSFTQQLGAVRYRLDSFANGSFTGSLDGRRIFECSGNTRVVTSLDGRLLGVVGAAAATVSVSIRALGGALPEDGGQAVSAATTLTVRPNQEWSLDGSRGEGVLGRHAPFTAPFGISPTNCTQGTSHDSCVPPL
jgi:hypothetical protein